MSLFPLMCSSIHQTTKLQLLVRTFACMFIDYKNNTYTVLQNSFKQIIIQITNLVFAKPLEKEIIERLSTQMVSATRISNCPAPLWISDGKTQQKITSSLSNLLSKVIDSNWHSVQAPCKSLDKKTGECNHNNEFVAGAPGTHIFRCVYHLDDSLLMHLVLAAIYNGIWAIQKSLSSDMVLLSILLGLYHDIGKPLTMETCENATACFLAYHAHDMIGSLIVKAHWSPEMPTLGVTEEGYTNLCDAILKHMVCGYHEDSPPDCKNRQHLKMGIGNQSVRQLLIMLQLGDTLGKPITAPVLESTLNKFWINQALNLKMVHLLLLVIIHLF